jgi:hypothetical protein
MHPAIEIDLHLDHICAAQRQTPVIRRATFRAPNIRHQPAPPSAYTSWLKLLTRSAESMLISIAR